jgi:hypothetical protein
MGSRNFSKTQKRGINMEGMERKMKMMGRTKRKYTNVL